MLIDLLIIILAISALYRGLGSGFARQLLAAIGFFGGLFLGSWLQPFTVRLASTPAPRAFIVILTTLGCALIGLTIGEFAGLRLKLRLFGKQINKLDNGLGGALNIVALLLSVWLLASIAIGLPFNGIKNEVRSSHIISALNRILPPAPNIIASLGHLIDPNGFPDVFIGNEPVPPSQVNLPALGDLASAVNADKNSVVRIKGQGCGGIVSGSGFVVGPGLVATNAHVVAGITTPFVQDIHGSRAASVVWFDPNLDFAVLRVPNLNEPSLSLANSTVSRGTPAAVLGYPGGGAFNAGQAAVLDEFSAVGRNIYGSGHTVRDVYALKADVIPGNSGGPLVTEDGHVIGVVFAESTSYDHVGYALTTTQISSELKQADKLTRPVGTGSCAE
ncbi:MAG TPA: MarP family serine protease [Candidatus Saccharimonadales bacterium]|nr:MarP family serine protease [Candidatus Saccharimonadales bacterium]